jgi:hypothetical protein
VRLRSAREPVFGRKTGETGGPRKGHSPSPFGLMNPHESGVAGDISLRHPSPFGRGVGGEGKGFPDALGRSLGGGDACCLVRPAIHCPHPALSRRERVSDPSHLAISSSQVMDRPRLFVGIHQPSGRGEASCSIAWSLGDDVLFRHALKSVEGG